MARFLEKQGPSCREKLHSPLSTATYVCQKKKNRRRRRLCNREVEDPERVFHISATEMILNLLMGLLSPHQSRTTWVLLASI